MSRKQVTLSVAGLVIAMALVARVVMGRSSGADEVAADTTGVSAAPAVSTAASPSAAAVAAKPVLVINPRSIPHGASVGVWGSGFPSGAPIAIYLKQDASDNVGAVSVVEADKSGQFGAVSVTVPDSVASGIFMIQAKDQVGGTTATALATVVDAAAEPADQPSVAATLDKTSAPPPRATWQPTAMAESTPQPGEQPRPTEQPTLAEDRQPTSEPKPLEQPFAAGWHQATPQPTESPKGTQQSQATPKPTEAAKSAQSRPTAKPTEAPKPAQQSQPTPTPQPTSTPKPQPTPQPQPQSAEPPRPTEPPKPPDLPKPAEPPQPNPASDSNSYTIHPGDSLSAIAQQVYGDSNAWHSLYDANHDAIGGDPNLIHPGTELVIPPKD